MLVSCCFLCHWLWSWRTAIVVFFRRVMASLRSLCFVLHPYWGWYQLSVTRIWRVWGVIWPINGSSVVKESGSRQLTSKYGENAKERQLVVGGRARTFPADPPKSDVKFACRTKQFLTWRKLHGDWKLSEMKAPIHGKSMSEDGKVDSNEFQLKINFLMRMTLTTNIAILKPIQDGSCMSRSAITLHDTPRSSISTY